MRVFTVAPLSVLSSELDAERYRQLVVRGWRHVACDIDGRAVQPGHPAVLFGTPATVAENESVFPSVMSLILVRLGYSGTW